MKRFTGVFSILLILISYVHSREINHITENLNGSKSASSTFRMTQKIKDAAIKYENYGPIPRFVECDYAFASDLNEYKKLNGFGILFITSLNRDSTEYPIARVYFKSEGGNADELIDLKLIGS